METKKEVWISVGELKRLCQEVQKRQDGDLMKIEGRMLSNPKIIAILEFSKFSVK